MAHETSGRDPDTNQPDPDVAESLRASNPNANGPRHLEGGMGISSERVGPTGPDQVSTDGMRGTAPDPTVDPEAPPEQTAGGEEPKPVGLPPKAPPPRSNRGEEDAAR